MLNTFSNGMINVMIVEIDTKGKMLIQYSIIKFNFYLYDIILFY